MCFMCPLLKELMLMFFYFPIIHDIQAPPLPSPQVILKKLVREEIRMLLKGRFIEQSLLLTSATWEYIEDITLHFPTFNP